MGLLVARRGSLNPRRVAPGGPFSPLDIGWHVALYADDLTLSNDDPVATWPDSSGNGRAAAQGTASKRPIYKAAWAPLNSQPAVKADGVDDVIFTSLFTDVPQPYSVVVVGSVVPGPSFPYVAQGGGTGATANVAVYRNSTNVIGTAGTDGPSRAHDTDPHLWRFLASGASSVLDKDGSVSATANAGARASSRLGLFGRDDSLTAVFSAGAVGFAGIYDGDVAADPLWPDFKSFVATKYALTIS